MNYNDCPNLPKKLAKVAIVDGRINRKIEESLMMYGIKLVKTARYPGMYEAICFHPDIMFHHVGENRVVYAPGTDTGILTSLKSLGFDLVKGSSVLSSKYPYDIAYNVARVGKFAFHNVGYTDPVLRQYMENEGVEFVHIKQGYAKCSISIVNEKCIITGDKGIARAAETRGIETLLIEMEENILLPGLKYGFIGGSSAVIESNKWALTGNIESLKSASKITSFLCKKNVQIVCLSDEQVIDIGSIIPLPEL